MEMRSQLRAVMTKYFPSYSVSTQTWLINDRALFHFALTCIFKILLKTTFQAVTNTVRSCQEKGNFDVIGVPRPHQDKLEYNPIKLKAEQLMQWLSSRRVASLHPSDPHHP